MKIFFSILLFIGASSVFAQTPVQQLLKRMETFHDLMVQKSPLLDQYVHDSLRYGHSNGMIETKKDFLNSKVTYNKISADSLEVMLDHQTACIRYKGDFDVTMNGNRNTVHLSVLEVWMKKNKQWVLLARQAVR